MGQTNPQHPPNHAKRGWEAAAPLPPVQLVPSTAQGLQHRPHPQLEQGPEQSEWHHQPRELLSEPPPAAAERRGEAADLQITAD